MKKKISYEVMQGIEVVKVFESYAEATQFAYDNQFEQVNMIIGDKDHLEIWYDKTTNYWGVSSGIIEGHQV